MKYDADQLKALGAKGHAFRNADGSYSYPIDDAEDLDNAVQAVGRGGADHDAIRRYVIARAKAMGMADKIPDTWNGDGSLRSTDLDFDSAGFIRDRTYAVDLEIRGDGRTVYGIAVPFDQVARVNDGRGPYDEVFRMGAFRETIINRSGARVKLMANHDAKRFPVGRATSLREDPAGLVGEFHVSATRDGDEALELVRDGVLDSFSVGFTPVKHQRNREGVVERLAVALREVSVVAFPAYAGAAIAGVRLDPYSIDAALVAALGPTNAPVSSPVDLARHSSGPSPAERRERWAQLIGVTK